MLRTWAVAGRPIVGHLFGQDVRPEALLTALAAGGVVVAAFALFLGQVLVGRGTTGVLAGSWVNALCWAAVTLAVVEGSPSTRTAWAFLAGEITALVGTVVAVSWPHRRMAQDRAGQR